MIITKDLKDNKVFLLRYFRNRAAEEMHYLASQYAAKEFKEKTRALNRYLIQSRDNVIAAVKETSESEQWSRIDTLECLLMVVYTNDVVMLESRNAIWDYDYMAFSRRIGELWEPFCKVCFNHPLTNIRPYIAPLFSDVKRDLTNEIKDFISGLRISDDEKIQLNKYYDKVWSLVTSGEIKLECDLHFTDGTTKYVVDFKSRFGSNEKGNTNRLLLVGAIYKSMEQNYKCMLFVRSEQNNHYLNTLENSGVWTASCGNDTYSRIQEYTGYNLRRWIDQHLNWMEDFNLSMVKHIESNNLQEYLEW